MDLKGEYQINNDRDTVWQALNDPDMLQKCIPGCESLEKVSDTEFVARITAAIGPVRARFNTALKITDPDPPYSYRLSGESKGGAAGFGSGGATVMLEEKEGGTLLRYDADFKVGGKLAQVGSRLVLGATQKTADQFFRCFSRELESGAAHPPAEPAEAAARSSRWWAVAGIIAVLLVLWFLLR